ncbi:MAG: DUF4446 family protein [bacterium]|nr:DUF4446 family protein [bacterium]
MNEIVLFTIGALIVVNIVLLVVVIILRANIKRVEERQKGELILSSLSIGGTRYDAFQGMSGKLSFSLAFMAGDKGIILTSIHTREQSYLYLKPYTKENDNNLTEEEKKAVEVALKEGYTIKDI